MLFLPLASHQGKESFFIGLNSKFYALPAPETRRKSGEVDSNGLMHILVAIALCFLGNLGNAGTYTYLPFRLTPKHSYPTSTYVGMPALSLSARYLAETPATVIRLEWTAILPRPLQYLLSGVRTHVQSSGHGKAV